LRRLNTGSRGRLTNRLAADEPTKKANCKTKAKKTRQLGGELTACGKTTTTKQTARQTACK